MPLVHTSGARHWYTPLVHTPGTYWYTPLVHTPGTYWYTPLVHATGTHLWYILVHTSGTCHWYAPLVHTGTYLWYMPLVHTSGTYLLTYAHRSQWSTLFWAALVIPDQLVPCCFSSASVSRLQLLQGRVLFLFPCGFHVRAWRVVLDAGFLRVCPIQPHFLRSICLATGSCPAHSHRSSFRIFSCHWILQMRLRQVLKNVWIFRCIAMSHIRKAGLTSHWS